MNAPSSPTRGHRLWLPVTFAVLAGGAVTFLWLRPEFERNLRDWATAGAVVLTFLLTLVWFLFLGRFHSRTRLHGFLLLSLIAVALIAFLRVDGTADGRGLPKFAWRWAHRQPLSVVQPETSLAIVATSPDIKDVPQFWGTHRDGIVRDARLSPDWKTNPPKELWRQAIGAGWSAFSVVGGRAYTHEQRDELETVSCYELLTGRLLWAHTNPVHFSQWQSGDGPHATPTVFQGEVFAIGATGILDCLDAITGKNRWSRKVLDEHGLENLTWGVSASPLVFDDTVIVTGGQTRGLNLFAYHRKTGDLLWKAGDDGTSYASPILGALTGKRVVISNNAAALAVHDSATGALLLNYTWGGDKMPKGAQPILLGNDRIFLSAGYGMGCQVIEITASTDNKLAATEVWRNLKMKNQFNSTAVRNGYLYGLDDGQLACIDIATGERRWKEGRFGSGQTLLVDDMIIIQSEPGDVILMAAHPDKPNELGRLPALSSKTWNHPTLAGRYLLVRNDREAVCYELPLKTP